ncbi:sigma-70 family RNA polymerase sigma factor [Patescibacteria group bacterium]|nr:sigma-70 family RNA polymerase sigma factor [Patescibacteria group bacterium]
MRKIEQERRSSPELEVEPDNLVALYFREVAKAPILKASEERELFRQLRRGEAARDELINQDGHLSPKKRKELQSLKEDGNQAKTKINRSNLRLVISVAKYRRGQGVSFLDLIQEGNIGLMKAINKFDQERGYKFSTYAIHWIRQAVRRAVAYQGRTIRIPVHTGEDLSRLKRKRAELSKEIGRELDLKETAEISGWSEARTERILNLPEVILSLDLPIGADENSYLGEFIEDEKILSPMDAAAKELLRERMREVVNSLSPRQAKVLRLRFGLDDNGREHTLEEVGKALGVTRERARQIEAEALRKLRHPSRAREIKDFLK